MVEQCFESVKGSTILYAAGTSLHQLVLAYLEKIGLSADDVSLVPMDYQTGLQTFLLGEADIIALPTNKPAASGADG